MPVRRSPAASFGGVALDANATRIALKPLGTSLEIPRMPCRSMSPSSDDVTDCSVTPRAAAMFAIPAVRQAASACNTHSTGVGPLSCLQSTAGLLRLGGVGCFVAVFAAGAGEVGHRGLHMRSTQPLALGTKLESGELRLVLHDVDCGEQAGGMDPIEGGWSSSSERLSLRQFGHVRTWLRFPCAVDHWLGCAKTPLGQAGRRA